MQAIILQTTDTYNVIDFYTPFLTDNSGTDLPNQERRFMGEFTFNIEDDMAGNSTV